MTVEELLAKDRFAALLGVRLVAAGGDHVAVELPLQPRHFDRSGRVASGVVFSLADCAMSLISNRHGEAVAVATHLTRFGDGAGADSLGVEVSAVFTGTGRATTWQAVVRADGIGLAAFTGTTLRMVVEEGRGPGPAA